MPIPKPHKGQTDKQYISSCMSFLMHEDYSSDQAFAICEAKLSKSKLKDINNLTQKDIDLYLTEIFSGQLNLFSLAKSKLATDVFNFTFKTLDDSLHKGWGNLKEGEDILQLERAIMYRQNIAKFSAAKTWQEAKALTKVVFDANGAKRPFPEFKEFAGRINSQFNENWLKTEQNSVFTQSQNAKQGLKIIDEQDIFPYIIYRTTQNDRVRPSHAALEGLTFKVGDPAADNISPQNGWNCYCRWEQSDEAKPTAKSKVTKQTKLVNNDFKTDTSFKGNPAKKNYIFKDKGVGKHEYFKVPKQFKRQLNDNFGFELPKGY